ncbi:helix-turn-helix domain-containing protein [Thermomonospora umbrina]|nr:helix-turn-helix transcriptional regulator [Thermomonospora umbrina]
MALGARLRRHRESRGLPHEAAAYALLATDSKIRLLEAGRAAVRMREVIALCDLYGVDDIAERSALLGLARQAKRPGWWEPFRPVIPAWVEPFLGLEQAARRIRCYEIQFVPGLLQTRDYARAVIGLGHPPGGGDAEKVEMLVELRMRRQQVLRRDRPPHLWVILDEAALRRTLGGRTTMYLQMQHLIDIADAPNISVQIVPFDKGGHAATGGPITLLRLPEPGVGDVVYLEQLTSAQYVDEPCEVVHYRHILNQLATQAATPQETISILRRMIRDL